MSRGHYNPWSLQPNLSIEFPHPQGCTVYCEKRLKEIKTDTNKIDSTDKMERGSKIRQNESGEVRARDSSQDWTSYPKFKSTPKPPMSHTLLPPAPLGLTLVACSTADLDNKIFCPRSLPINPAK